MKKRILPLLLSLLLTVSLTACKPADTADGFASDTSGEAAVSSQVSSEASSEPVSSAVSSEASSTSSAAASSLPASSAPASSRVTVSEPVSSEAEAQASSKAGEPVEKIAAQSAVPSSDTAPVASAESSSVSETVSGTPLLVDAIPPCGGEAGEVEQKLFLKINDKRAELGLETLTWDDGYHTAAHIRSNELPTAFDHVRLDGRTWSTIFTEVGLPTYPGRENLIFAGNGALLLSVDEVVDTFYDGWITSQDHYENLTASDVNVSGLCVLYTEKDIYATQLFGHR